MDIFLKNLGETTLDRNLDIDDTNLEKWERRRWLLFVYIFSTLFLLQQWSLVHGC